MNSHQMICHLNDSFKAVIGEKSVSMNVNIFYKTIGKWFALYLPINWPHGVPTRPEIDQEKNGSKPIDFDKDLNELKEFIERLTKENKDFKWSNHPLFGEMSQEDWMRWAYLHVDHHLRQFGV